MKTRVTVHYQIHVPGTGELRADHEFDTTAPITPQAMTHLLDAVNSLVLKWRADLEA